ncbi:DUF3558 family protein [Saccharomonospora azurea]|uniref:DUF3558 family protein n=1 Tax=Saccharomonospora azurea TaxID=40988 RepID=UPI0009E4659E|nr:DUF3558 family protein [Saccharomonospora azurea]
MSIGMPKRWASAAISVFALTIVSGCGQSEEGSAAPNTESVAPSVTSQAATSAVGDAQSIDLCSLLTESDLAEYGTFDGPEERELRGYAVCSWADEKASASDMEAPLIDLMFIGDRGAADVVDLGDGLQNGKTENTGRELVKTSGVDSVTGAPVCVIAMSVSDGSRLDVTVGRTADPCDLAGQLVELVDPKLPRG